MKSILKNMLNEIISGKQEQAAVSMHDYFVSKTRLVAGLSEAKTKSINKKDVEKMVQALIDKSGLPLRYFSDVSTDALTIEIDRESFYGDDLDEDAMSDAADDVLADLKKALKALGYDSDFGDSGDGPSLEIYDVD